MGRGGSACCGGDDNEEDEVDYDPANKGEPIENSQLRKSDK